MVSKKRSHKIDHPHFDEKTKLEPESPRAVQKHVRGGVQYNGGELNIHYIYFFSTGGLTAYAPIGQ